MVKNNIQQNCYLHTLSNKNDALIGRDYLKGSKDKINFEDGTMYGHDNKKNKTAV